MQYWKTWNPESLPIDCIADRTGTWNNNIFTLDTETTSVFNYGTYYGTFDYSKKPEFYSECEKSGFVYIWQLSINNEVFFGRYLNELREFLFKIQEKAQSTIIIYIHNLAFEFQFLCNIIDDFEVFARKSRHPIKAYSEKLNIEFRCSLMLTNMSLEKLPKAMNLSIEKQVGKLDYMKLHLPVTPLTDDEMLYCEYDCLVLYEVIKKYKTEYENVKDIPLTQTGKVRKVIKKIYKNNSSYYNKLKKMLPVTFEEFKVLCDAYAGGYTHANALFTGQVLENVFSMDITSSYPTVMLAEKFPMSRFVKIKLKSVDEIKYDKFAYVIDITFHNLKSICSCTYLSKSKAISLYNSIEDNGRIVLADNARYLLTETDFDIVRQCYKFDYEVNECWIATKERLDTYYIKYIVELYENKTQYKGLPEKDDLYRRSKEYINALYGMCVTNLIRDDVIFSNGEWCSKAITKEEAEEKLIKLTQRRKTFLNYAWGVWITAYARHNLWEVMLKMSDDVVYTDTDSIKFVNEHNRIFFEQYNEAITEKLKKAMEYHNIPYDRINPQDTKGKYHPLGLYDYEGKYDKFVTLGAKKYCDEKDGELEITVSGVTKKGAQILKSVNDFKTGLVFDYYNSGRLIMSYNDAQNEMVLTDYLGNTCSINQKYGINAMPTTYTISLSESYEDYLTRISAESSNHAEIITGVKED